MFRVSETTTTEERLTGMREMQFVDSLLDYDSQDDENVLGASVYVDELGKSATLYHKMKPSFGNITKISREDFFSFVPFEKTVAVDDPMNEGKSGTVSGSEPFPEVHSTPVDVMSSPPDRNDPVWISDSIKSSASGTSTAR